MGYRGDNVSATHGAWERPTPWRADDGYLEEGQHAQAGAGYGPPDDQRGASYGQQPGYGAQQSYDELYTQPYPQHAGQYGDQAAGGYQEERGETSGYRGQPGYAEHDPYGYELGGGPGAGYEQGGYDRPADGYGPDGGQYPSQGGYQGPGGGGYPALDGGYQQLESGRHQGPGGYDGPSGYQDPGGYQAPAGGYQGGGGYQGSGGYQGGGGYPDRGSGYGQADGYGQPDGYQARGGGSGGYPALPRGGSGYQAEDAGNDWYGGQPAAASGASFADTGSYRLNGQAIEEYGTGPRRALRDPVRGLPPGAGQPDAGQVATSVIPAFSEPQPGRRSGPQAAQRTGPYPRFDGPAPAVGRGPDYSGTAVDDAYQTYDDYPSQGPDYSTQRLAAPGTYRQAGYDGYDGAPSGPDGGAGYDGFDTVADPYSDRYGEGGGIRTPGGGAGGGRGGRRPGSGGGLALGPLRGGRLLLAALAVVVIGIVCVAAYVFVIKPKPSASSAGGAGPLPSASMVPSQQQCAQTLGTYCHIESRADDPAPLTTAALFPPEFANEKDQISYSLVSTKTDTTCSSAVIGSALTSALKSGQCTQVLRASYVSSDGKIMGTIGVVNLSTTTQAHYAGKVVGQNDFIAPLTAAKGVASKLGNGTGVVEAEFKGHYLILIWSEYVDGTTPKTTAQKNQLEQFGNDLVAGTANVTLTQRMVSGTSAGASAPASSSATASTKASAKAS